MMTRVQRLLFALLLTSASLFCGAAAGPASQTTAGGRSGRTLIEASIRAIGGLDVLRSLGTVRTAGIEVLNELATHDRPGMTLYPRIFQFTEWRDATNRRRRYEAKEIGAADPFNNEVVMNRDVAMRTFGGNPLSDRIQLLWGFPALQQSEEALLLAPEQALPAALAANDLQVLPDAELDGEPQDTLEFHHRQGRVRLLLNKDNHLPSAVEITREMPDESFFGEMGELTTSIRFASWWLVEGKLRYPREWWIYFRDQLQRTLVINEMELRAKVGDDSFAIPDNLAAAFRNRTVKSIEDLSLAALGEPPQEIAPGIVFLPGFMNVVLVKQEDGVVVIEAPLSCGYSSSIIAESGRRFPGAPIKAVISTSDAPVHFGGVREYVARGIPVYLRDANLPSLEALLAAPHKVLLDAYARAPKPPDFRVVSSQVTVGGGANRLEILPVHIAGGERSLLVYLPEHRLLYVADLPVRGNGRPFPFRGFTLAEAVAQEHLAVDRVFGIHPKPMPWKDVEGVQP